MDEEKGMEIYPGGCHCGAVTVAVKSNPPPDVEVKEDNCSICRRVRPSPSPLLTQTLILEEWQCKHLPQSILRPYLRDREHDYVSL